MNKKILLRVPSSKNKYYRRRSNKKGKNETSNKKEKTNRITYGVLRNVQFGREDKWEGTKVGKGRLNNQNKVNDVLSQVYMRDYNRQYTCTV